MDARNTDGYDVEVGWGGYATCHIIVSVLRLRGIVSTRCHRERHWDGWCVPYHIIQGVQCNCVAFESQLRLINLPTPSPVHFKCVQPTHPFYTPQTFYFQYLCSLSLHHDRRHQIHPTQPNGCCRRLEPCHAKPTLTCTRRAVSHIPPVTQTDCPCHDCRRRHFAPIHNLYAGLDHQGCPVRNPRAPDVGVPGTMWTACAAGPGGHL